MAPTQDIERALRERFGSEEAIVTLAEILSFLKSHQKQQAKAGNQKQKPNYGGTQQNATPEAQPRETTRKTTRKTRATPTPTAENQEITCQVTCQAMD